jgi:hypothetical protein
MLRGALRRHWLQTKNFEGPDAMVVAWNSNLRSPGAKEDVMIEANVQRLNEEG